MSNVKITTELDDKASAGLKKLKDQLDGVGKGGSGLSGSIKDLASNFKELGSSGSLSAEALMSIANAGKATAGQLVTNVGVLGAASLGFKTYAQMIADAAKAENIFTEAVLKRNQANEASKAFTAANGRVNNKSTDPGMMALAAEKQRLNQLARDANGELASLGAAKNMAQAEVATASFVRTAVIGLGSVAAAGAVAYGAFNLIAFNARDAADAAAEMADKLGITTSELEALKLVADENSGSVEGLQHVFDKLAKSMNKMDQDNEKTQFAFESLGLTMEDVAGKSEKEVAGIIIKNYELLGRSTKATAAVQQLLGPAFREQIPAIKEMSAHMGDAEDRIKKYGAAASDELIAKGGEQEKAMSNMKLAWQGLANEIGLSSSSIIKDTAEMITSLLDMFRRGMSEMNKAQALNEGVTPERRAMYKDIDPARRHQISAQVRSEQTAGQVGQANSDFIKRRLELYDEELVKLGKLKVAETDTSENSRLANRARADAMDRVRKTSEAAKLPDKTKEAKDLKSALEEMALQLNIANRAFGVDESVKQGLEARKKFAEDIKKGIDPKYAASLLKQADAAIAVGVALRKAAEEQKAFEEAKGNIEDYKLETDLIAYEATLIGKSAEERQKLIDKFREEAVLRKVIAGLSDADAKAIADQTRAAMEARDAAKAALEDSKIINEILDQSQSTITADVQRRILAATALLESGKINVDDYLKYVNGQMARFKDEQKKDLDEIQTFWAEAAKGIEGDFKSFFFDIMQGNMSNLGASMKKTIDGIIAQMLAAKAATALFGSSFDKGNLGGYIGSAATWLGSLFGGARASGGSVQPGRAYLVGERGPEPFIPSTAGTIMPTGSLQSSSNITVNLTAIDTKDFVGKMVEVKRELATLVNSTNRGYRLQGA
jgi:hypothetical protein